MKKQKLPKGWDKKRIERVLTHYENQTDAEAAAEDEAALGGDAPTLFEVPPALVGKVRKLIAVHSRGKTPRPPKRVRGAA
jgi:hypothetical protein